MPFHKKLFGTIGGAVTGFLRGGPTGAITGAVKGYAGARGRSPSTALTVRRPTVTAFAPNGKQGPDLPRDFPGAIPEPGFKGGLQRFLPFGQSGYTGAPPGYHVNKAYLRYLRAEQMGRQAQNPFNEPRAKNTIVRNRKMNPLNPRALMRANARQVAAVRMMRRTLRGTGYTIQRSRFGAKKGRRR